MFLRSFFYGAEGHGRSRHKIVKMKPLNTTEHLVRIASEFVMLLPYFSLTDCESMELSISTFMRYGQQHSVCITKPHSGTPEIIGDDSLSLNNAYLHIYLMIITYAMFEPEISFVPRHTHAWVRIPKVNIVGMI